MVYQASKVSALHSFYKEALTDYDSFPKIVDHLAHLSEFMLQGLKGNVDAVFSELNNYHSNFLGTPIDQLKERNWELEDCYHCIANEYGFKNWNSVLTNCNIQYNLNFENAVNVLLKGDLFILKSIIKKNPELINMRSQYGHRASLLHYTGSNGVEFWRQVVPHNLLEITKFLLESGADPRTKMFVYGGEFTTRELLVTSAHPIAAGVIDEMKDLFS